jgi:endoglycosylceramidase
MEATRVWPAVRSSVTALVAVGLAACHSSSPTPAPNPSACTITPPAPSTWRLVANGTNFQDALGRTVLLRGVNAGERSKFAPYFPFDYTTDAGYADALSTYMDHAALWGIDVMRVPFTWDALEPTQGMNDQGWLDRFDQFVAAAWARGIWTVLDFHQDIYSQSFCGDGFPGWTIPDAGPYEHDCSSWQLEYYNDVGVQTSFDRFWDAGSPVQSQYVSAWDLMVARYKDTPGVIGFEPINEPGWGSGDEETFTATTLTAFYSMMVPHMNAEAPSALIFLDPPGPDGTNVSTMLGKPASGTGIVFAPHYYPIGGEDLASQSGLAAWQAVGQAWNVPVFLGEFGASNTNPNNTDYMISIFDELDTLNMGGSQWEYSVSPDEWNYESFSLVAPDGGEYPLAQAVQRPYARALAGSAMTEAFDSTTNTFTLSFTPSPTPSTAITEVALPVQTYPTGYATTVTGACFDATSSPGRLLLQPASGATTVSLTIAPK